MAASPTPSLTAADIARIDAQLAATDRLLERNYPGDDGSRQPVHTVYVPADRFTPSFAADWGAQALAAAAAHGGLERLGALLGQDAELAAAVASRVRAKLESEPIEDLRLDFEDGFGDRGDDAEDAAAVAAASAVAAAVAAGTAPPFIGIRFKCFEAATRARGLRTLDLFVSGLAAAGELPDGLVLDPAQGHHGGAGAGHGLRRVPARGSPLAPRRAGSASRCRWKRRS